MGTMLNDILKGKRLERMKPRMKQIPKCIVCGKILSTVKTYQYKNQLCLNCMKKKTKHYICNHILGRDDRCIKCGERLRY